MKYLFLLLPIAALLWIASIVRVNRRSKSPCDNRGSGGEGDCGASSPAGCASHDGGCGGGGD